LWACCCAWQALLRPAAALVLELFVHALARSGMLYLDARCCVACARPSERWDRGVTVVVYLRGRLLGSAYLEMGHRAAWAGSM
jgi:hypothetical protein